MSWFKLLTASVLVALTAACGFEPIAAPGRAGAGFGDKNLALSNLTILIDDDYTEDERFEYALHKELSRYVDIGVAGAQSLKIDVKLSESGLAIEQDDTITRLNFTAKTTYTLTDPASDTPQSGKFSSITAVNATASQFSTSVASREAYDRLAVDIARKTIMVLRVKASNMLPVPPAPEAESQSKTKAEG